MYGIEQAIDQVIAKLQADLPGKIGDLNDEYADVYLLTVPATSSYDIVFDEQTAQRLFARGGYPAVIVEPQPERVVGDVAMGTNEYIVQHLIQVSVVVNVPDWRTHQILLMRYLRALKEILSPPDAITCGDIRYTGGGFKSEFLLAKSEVLRDIAALFTVTTYQTPA